MSETEKVATPGFDFFDLKYSGCSLISAVDIPAVMEGVTVDDNGKVTSDNHVSIGGATKVYGPYRLDRVFSRGNGKIVFVGFNDNSKSNGQKPLTKAELEAQAITLTVQKQAAERKAAEEKAAHEAEIATLKAALAARENHGKR